MKGHASTQKERNRMMVFAMLAAVLVVSIAANIMSGSVHISPGELLQVVKSRDITSTAGFIVWKIRMPRLIAALLGGAFLAVAGLLLQVFFRNPIVGPFILGISSGATLMVSLVMLTTLMLGFKSLAPFLTSLSALAGATITMTIVLAIASRVKNPITLLIVGLMMGYLCHSITSVLVAFAEQEKVKGFILWQLGSFSGFKWREIEILLIFGGIVTVMVYGLGKPLNAFLLGEEYASTMGVNIRLFRFFIIFCSCALAGLVTAAAGPVAFIGLAVPHMARLCFGTSDNRILIPGVMIIGAAVTSVCDLVARLVFSPVELPISAITALFGAPIVISLLVRKRVAI